MAARIWECDNATYHASAEVSSTHLKTILASPRDYYETYIAKTREREGSKAMLLGSALHARVLEPQNYSKLFAVEPECDGRSTAGKAIKAQFALTAIGKTIVPAAINQQARDMAKNVLAEPLVRDLLAGAAIEQAIVWDDGDIACKMKGDIFQPRPDLESDLLLDLKTADDPTPECFLSPSAFSPIRKYRYDLQLEHYTQGRIALTGRPCSAGLIVVGSSEPFDVFVYDITEWLTVGAVWRHRAMELLRRGRSANIWRRPEQDEILRAAPAKWDYPE